MKSFIAVEREKCELEGPFECSSCEGHVMLDASYLEQVAEKATCPYCQQEMIVPEAAAQTTTGYTLLSTPKAATSRSRYLVALQTDIVCTLPENPDLESKEVQRSLRADFIDFLQSAEHVELSFSAEYEGEE